MFEQTLNLHNWQRAFHVDGSLRDIYVHETTAWDWSKFMQLVARYNPVFYREGEAAVLPDRVEGLPGQFGAAALLLSFSPGKVGVNCHFFVEDEIELDVDLREVTSPLEVKALMAFMVELGRSLKKNVTLTEEGSPTWKWFGYEHTDDSIILF
ncbi:hypothetical protein [Celeribacter ethanolicus]|uniref:hypothetical protein n=1 Tax=Celeribacter ethanolicus TaxID=1758178 RepID=UPI000A460185|nr:hypothetical protein [Celeribacter ethanolicus]